MKKKKALVFFCILIDNILLTQHPVVLLFVCLSFTVVSFFFLLVKNLKTKKGMKLTSYSS